MKKQIYFESLELVGLTSATEVSRSEALEYSNMKPSDLPEGVVYKDSDGWNTDGAYYKYKIINMTEEEIQTCLLAKAAHHLKTIKGCAVFFVVIAIISLVFSIINFIL